MDPLTALIFVVVYVVFCAVFLVVYHLGEPWAECAPLAPQPIPKIPAIRPFALSPDLRTEYERYLDGEVEDPRR